MEIRGTYGCDYTSCTLFIVEDYRGHKWYAVDGSTNVCGTWQELEDGVDVEKVDDDDYFTADTPIECIEDLEAEVEDYES